MAIAMTLLSYFSHLLSAVAAASLRYSVLLFGIASLFGMAETASAEEVCQYPGFLGGPFPGTPACTEGYKTTPLSCDRCSWFPDRDEAIHCADEADCVELVGKYMACGGPIGPFVVDDQDNVYFWSSRWNLHSLDKRGNLRWRFDLCEPAEDPMCQYDPDTCDGEHTRIPSMVMDYHGTLYFFIGDVLYAISSDGELLLRHRVAVPDVELAEHWSLSIASGAVDYQGGYWLSVAGSPVLHSNGTLSVAYAAQGRATGDTIPTGVITTSRTGRVLETGHYLWKQEPKRAVGRSNLVGTRSGDLLYFGSSSAMPFDGSWDSTGVAHLLEDHQPVWETSQPLDFPTIGQLPSDYLSADLAVDEGGRIYGVTDHGAVYAFDPETHTQKRIFNIQHPGSVTWQNRPTVAPDGTLYFVTATRTGGFLWALDTEELWRNPVPERTNYQWMPNPANYAGLKWRRVYSGDGGWSTPAIAANGRVYTAQGGIAAHDGQTGDTIWQFGERTMASAPTILSDGTLVVGQGITGRVFFLKEDTPNGGHAQSGWPLPRHDRYMSNNAQHPFRWDRSGQAPYEPLDELLAEEPPCWNLADWDAEECGPKPEPRYRTEPPADAGDVGGSDGDADGGVSTDVAQKDVDADANRDTPPSTPDVEDAQPSDVSAPVEPKSRASSDCAGCNSMSVTRGSLAWFVIMGLLGFWALAKRRTREK